MKPTARGHVSLHTLVGSVFFVVALAWVPAASAATLGGTNPLLYDDAADTSNNSVLVVPLSGGLRYDQTPTLTASSPCTQAGTTGATCPGEAAYSFLMGSGNDQVIKATTQFLETVTMHGGAGNDNLINADVHSDATMGPTNTMTGEAGDDKMTADITVGGSSLIGGGDTDTAMLGVGSPPPLVVSLDGLANDGPAGAQTSNIDVENVSLGRGTVVGSATANEIKVGDGDSSVDGAGGGDTITMGNGTDSAAGGTGNDSITTGAGNDAVDPGPGMDVVSTGDGNDTINARDGEADTIDCGNGIDTLIADPGDAYSSDCETVDSHAVPSDSFTIGKLKGKKLSVDVPGPGTVQVKDASASKKKLLLKPSSATASGAGTVKVTLKLTKTAKEKLKKKGKVKVRAAITFTPTGGSANSQTKALKVKK